MLPSWLAVASLVAVAVAMLVFFVTGSPDDPAPSTRPVSVNTDSSPNDRPGRRANDHQQKPDRSHPPSKQQGKKQRDPQRQSPQAYVEVYNNSAVSGLAAQTASVLQDGGWNVLATDNWYGVIPESTVYYPDGLRGQARLLARDLGIVRMMPAVSPMSFDRLTVILTSAT